MHAPTRWKADLVLLLVAFIWGTAFVAQSIAGKAGLAFLYNAASFLVAALALFAAFPRRIRFDRAQMKWMGLAGTLLFGGSAFQQYGLFYTKVANASFLTCIYVVFTPFLLWLGFRERPGRIDLVAVAAAVVGAFLLSTGGKWEMQIGDILEILGALFWGFHLVLVAKFASRFDTISFAAGQFFVCGILNLLVGLFLEPLQALFFPAVIGAVLYRALLSVGVGYTLQVWAQKFTPPSDAALIFAMESVFAALVAWALLGEGLLLIQLVGCALILLGACLPQFRGKPAV